MNEQQSQKQFLPFPYNQDLSPILRRLDRRTPFSRERLANDPTTAAYLRAAMRLIEGHLGPGIKRELVDPEDDSSLTRPLLSFLSQRAVAAEVANNPEPFLRMGSVGALRSTWRSQSDFIADLLAFGLWSVHHPARLDNEVAARSEELLDGPEFINAVHALAYWDSTTLTTLPSFRLSLVAMASTEGDEVLREALVEHYQGVTAPWKMVYAEFLRARGLQLRRGVTLEEVANLLTALSDGTAIRALADPEAGVIDHSAQRSLLGRGALALVLGCMERTEQPDGLTLEEAAHALMYGP